MADRPPAGRLPNGHTVEPGPSCRTKDTDYFYDTDSDDELPGSSKLQKDDEKAEEEQEEGWLNSAKKAGRHILSKWKNGDPPDPKKETVKSRIWNAWNNVKYSSALRIDESMNYGGEHPILLLGEQYFPETFEPDQSFNDFYRDYYSRIWLTYRIGFEPLEGTTLRTDCGWGCMLRTGQMMVAQALLLLRHGRNWRWNLRGVPFQGQAPTLALEHFGILRLFEDQPMAPLGIHRLISFCENPQASAGSWFTPSEALGLLKKAITSSTSSLTAGLAVVVCVDGSLIVPVVERETRDWTRPLLLFICVRLGAHSVNKVYNRHLEFLLSMPNSLGIGGGKPNHSTYFIGHYHGQLIYLDPHVSHQYVPLEKELDEGSPKQKRKHKPFSSFHCRLLSKMPISSIDPSCAVGFLMRNKDEFEESMRYLNLNQVIDVELGTNLGSKRTKDPLFTVMHEEPKTMSPREATEFERKQAADHGFELL